jgi:hypothetical protein
MIRFTFITLGHMAFFEFDPKSEKADFSFHVTYEEGGTRSLVAEGHRNYFGLVLSGFSGNRGIGVDMKEALNAGEIGRDARRLQAALLKFPGFESKEQIFKQFGL